jgi:hypothetical protein
MSDDSFRNPNDQIDELLFGKEALARRRRAAEISHEHELARIRSESHALVWTGTTEELTATITRWYQAGWLRADSLDDALQKAAIHFHRPDGTPIIRSMMELSRRTDTPAKSDADAPSKRLKPTIYSPTAARKMEAYLEENGIGLTEFATKIGTTDRTLRSFRSTGRIKRSIFDEIAKGMGVNRDVLLKK